MMAVKVIVSVLLVVFSVTVTVAALWWKNRDF